METILNARAAVGDFREIIDSQSLLIFETEGTVIGRDDLQMILAETVPELIEMMLFAERWSENVFGAFEVWAGQLIDRQEQVLRAGFGKSGDAPVAGFSNFVEGVFRR